MNSQSAASLPQPRLFRFWPWLLVLVVLLFVGFIRVRLLEMPLERDEGEYAYAGQLILQGIPPYELAYNMKLPGTYYAYAAGMAVFGQTPAGIHLTLLMANSLTSIFVFLLGRKLFGVTAGLVSCATFALMTASSAVLGMAAHATQFVVLFAVPAILLLWCAIESNRRLTYFFSGLLFGLAFLMKQPGICFGLFGVAILFSRAVRDRSIFTRFFAVNSLTFGGAMILPLVFFCAAAAVAGDFGNFWFWTFNYAGYYVMGIPFHDGMQNLGRYMLGQSPVYGGFAALTGAGVIAALWQPKFRREFIFALAFLIISFLGTTPGLYFRMHYFVLLLPAVAILTGMAVVFLQRGVSPATKIIPLLVFAGVSGWSIYRQSPMFFQFSPLQLCEFIYRGNPFTESVPVAQYIREHSGPDARVAVIGSEPQIYFYARRRSATGYIYAYPLMENQPYAITMQHEMISEISAVRPEFVVIVMYGFSWLAQPTSNLGIMRWAGDYTRRFYEPVGVAGRGADGRMIWLSGKAVNDPHKPLLEYMTVYQRRPDAG